MGTLYIEARLFGGEIYQDTGKFQKDLEVTLCSSNLIVEIGDEILENKTGLYVSLGSLYSTLLDFVQSLKAVEYVGPKCDGCYALASLRVKVQVYQLYDHPRSLEEDKELAQAEIISMPHVRFDGRWDALFFDTNIKTDLIWIMSNILRFSQSSESEVGDMNPLILLHGPPGTGKTSLCQGLAQKIAIRLSDKYQETKLIQVKTATILSKFYSESARQVDQIFTKICQMCENDDETFICVLIDEVESIANSREKTMQTGEVQDSLRATNALLTGIDRAKAYRNIMLLCTSNFINALDAAFLDRCGLRLAIDPPSMLSQYAIICSRIKSLIARGVIQSEAIIPNFVDAENEFHDPEHHSSPGGKMVGIVKHIRAINNKRERNMEISISGRVLTQLPETAILRYLREEDCDLDMALDFIEQFLLTEYSCGVAKAEDDNAPVTALEISEASELCRKKRKITITFEDGCDEEILEEIMAKVRGPSQKRRYTIQVDRSKDSG